MGLIPAARVGVFRHDAQQIVPGRADRAGQEVRGRQVPDVSGARQQERLFTPEQEYYSSVANQCSLRCVTYFYNVVQCC